MSEKLRVFLIDDEPLALKRLSRLLAETGRIDIAGQTTEPLEALKLVPNLQLDALFLDIQMPELNGFELLRELEKYPPVVFTTAFDEYALEAFEVYSVDYLLKPVESERLKKALEKLEKMRGKTPDNLEKLLADFSAKFPSESKRPLEKIASRVGGKVLILDACEITCFFAQDKLTFAKNAAGREFPIDDSLNQLETALDAETFLRVHRGTIVNVNFIAELRGWFSGRVLIRLKDQDKTEIVVARDRVKVLKDFLKIT